jgi:hypothetical protein
MENFEEYLKEKYPDLFYKKEDGSLECPCGAWVPEGWQTIIDELCGAITSYTKGCYQSERVISNKMYYLWHYIGKFLDWSHKRFIKIFPKLNKREYNLPFYTFVGGFRQRAYNCVKYNRVYPPAVKIDQIKSKFSDLRFYYSGGDKKIDGMVTFASYLCSKTCEVSGEKGELCSSNGGWYKTLSPKIREENPYNSYKPTKQ